MTNRELQNLLITELENSRIEDAEINARWMMEDAFKCDRIALIMNAQELVSDKDESVVLEMLRRRKNNEPLQYILGHANFMGLDFIVTPDVLIPRPETEQLVELAGQNLSAKANVLDIGSGSGCIPIALKHFHPKTAVWGCDISDKALEVARENAKLLQQEVVFINRDALSNDFKTNWPVKFNLITSNPPYVPITELESLKPEVRDNEPHLALFVDDDPLIFYRKIASDVQTMLTENGRLIFEIHIDYADEVIVLMQENGFREIKCLNDFTGRPRMITGIK